MTSIYVGSGTTFKTSVVEAGPWDNTYSVDAFRHYSDVYRKGPEETAKYLRELSQSTRYHPEQMSRRLVCRLVRDCVRAKDLDDPAHRMAFFWGCEVLQSTASHKGTPSAWIPPDLFKRLGQVAADKKQPLMKREKVLLVLRGFVDANSDGVSETFVKTMREVSMLGHYLDLSLNAKSVFHAVSLKRPDLKNSLRGDELFSSMEQTDFEQQKQNAQQAKERDAFPLCMRGMGRQNASGTREQAPEKRVERRTPTRVQYWPWLQLYYD